MVLVMHAKLKKVNGFGLMYAKLKKISQVMYDIENKINLAVFPGLQVLLSGYGTTYYYSH